jgi:hypothetical protein
MSGRASRMTVPKRRRWTWHSCFGHLMVQEVNEVGSTGSQERGNGVPIEN